jgi:hypothetical protein
LRPEGELSGLILVRTSSRVLFSAKSTVWIQPKLPFLAVIPELGGFVALLLHLRHDIPAVLGVQNLKTCCEKFHHTKVFQFLIVCFGVHFF